MAWRNDPKYYHARYVAIGSSIPLLSPSPSSSSIDARSSSNSPSHDSRRMRRRRSLASCSRQIARKYPQMIPMISVLMIVSLSLLLLNAATGPPTVTNSDTRVLREVMDDEHQQHRDSTENRTRIDASVQKDSIVMHLLPKNPGDKNHKLPQHHPFRIVPEFRQLALPIGAAAGITAHSSNRAALTRLRSLSTNVPLKRQTRMKSSQLRQFSNPRFKAETIVATADDSSLGNLQRVTFLIVGCVMMMLIGIVLSSRHRCELYPNSHLPDEDASMCSSQDDDEGEQDDGELYRVLYSSDPQLMGYSYYGSFLAPPASSSFSSTPPRISVQTTTRRTAPSSSSSSSSLWTGDYFDKYDV